MASGKVGITFKELMSGGFAMGETDPETGAAKGKTDVLSMYGTVTIDDVNAFIGEANHPGVLDVVMDWGPFGTGIPAPGGVFNLFSPSRDPKLKLMVYEWPVVKDGKHYYFAGQKNVQEHPVFDLWKDTTTLYTHLYEGTDKTGPVVGAGIISLSVQELAKMTTTFKPLNSPSAEVGLAAIAEFGKFFMGQLWETYIKRADS
jgi:cholesterol oxidase